MVATELVTTASTFFIGVAMGARHACEPDHLAAVSLIADGEQRPVHVALHASQWAAAHVAGVALLGGLAVTSRLHGDFGIAASSELLVALLLTGVGASLLFRGIRARESGREKSTTRRSGRSILLGLLQGMAGSSGAVALFVVAQASWLNVILAVTGFACSIVAFACCFSFVLRRLRHGNLHRLASGVQLFVGIATLIVGVHLLWSCIR